jgi:hypothetical protein
MTNDYTVDDLQKYYRHRRTLSRMYITGLCKVLRTNIDYSSYCIRMMDDYFDNITPDDFDKINKQFIVTYTSLVSIWLIDKYIEDEPLLLGDIMKESPLGSDPNDLIRMETLLFTKCPNISKYVNQPTKSSETYITVPDNLILTSST